MTTSSHAPSAPPGTATGSNPAPQAARPRRRLHLSERAILVLFVLVPLAGTVVLGLWLTSFNDNRVLASPPLDPARAAFVTNAQQALVDGFNGIEDIRRSIASTDPALSRELASSLTRADYTESVFKQRLAAIVKDPPAQSQVLTRFSALRGSFNADDSPYRTARNTWTRLSGGPDVTAFVRFDDPRYRLDLGGGLVVSGSNLARMLQSPGTANTIGNLLLEQLTDDGPANPEKFDDRRQPPVASR